MARIDAHQHFWKYDPVRDAWITEEMAVLKQDYLPPDLEPFLHQLQIDGTVAVQADQSDAETLFLLSLARKYEWIKGVVGWIDLQDPQLEEKLQSLLSQIKLKGFRHILQSESRRDLMLDPAFKKGIALLDLYGFTYDILVLPDQVKYLPEFVDQFPGVRFVIDHLAKPGSNRSYLEEWKKNISMLGRYQNVYCKISGLVTEGQKHERQYSIYKSYMDVVTEAFGIRKIMFGSDWPVCLLEADYKQVTGIAENYFSSFSKDEQALFFGENAMKFYNLSV